MHQRGFSLIELLMGLTIVGIVLHLVSPAFAALTESIHRKEAAKSLVSGMRNARSAAITQNHNVVIHGINDDWGQGWRIVLDVSGKGHEDVSNPLLREHRSSTRVSVFGNQHLSTSVRFSRLGEPVHRGLQSGTLHVCAARAPVSQHQVVLASNGRVSLRSDKAEHALCAEGKKSEQGTNA